MKETLESASCELAPGDRGHFMRTFTGQHFYPLAPRIEDMFLADVAHHLAMQVRFNGATKDFYSVAEHCVIGSFLVPTEDAFEFLMHDAEETWLGDLIRPLKNHCILGFEYKRIAGPIDSLVRQKWGMLAGQPDTVRRVDQAMCAMEMQQIFRDPPQDTDFSVWKDIVGSAGVPLHFWSWREAEFQFLRRFYELTLSNEAETYA